jgi:hypothetical protein
MSVLGWIQVLKFMEKTHGAVRGQVVTDAKVRIYAADYKWRVHSDGFIYISRLDENAKEVKIPQTIPLDESLVAFFGLYSGDGAKGSESKDNIGFIKPVISFSQREPNLVRFALQQFKILFPGAIHFTFSLGEDAAFFMGGAGWEMLKDYYKGKAPATPELKKVRPTLALADKTYLSEKRHVDGTNEKHLAFYYFHKPAMEAILSAVKRADLEMCGIKFGSDDRVVASLRRPFKKGAREPGGSSRSDELHVGGLTGLGELFLKMLHEIEDSIYADSQISSQGLIQWVDKPSLTGEIIKTHEFFTKNSFGELAGERPLIKQDGNHLLGRWPRSKVIRLAPYITIDPLFSYIAGLYMAEGSTPKSSIFNMFSRKINGLNLSFTSSENTSIELVIRSLAKLFAHEDCVDTWKIKVGSQYFPELVVIGLKQGVPMLRGGDSGDGKLRTMEISLSLKPWALDVIHCLRPFEHKFSHVEPTGAGLARIDFSASSALCKWYFPLLVYTMFHKYVKKPSQEFAYD